jgi:hypothetical protein
MKKISSKFTIFHKKIFPALLFGFLGIFIILLIIGAFSNRQLLLFLTAPIFMAAICYFMMKKMVFDLIDEVYDEGYSLLFRNSGKEVRVNLKDIKNVSYSTIMSPPKVTMSIRHETEFGKELSFLPPAVFVLFKKNRDIEELIDRVDKARS